MKIIFFAFPFFSLFSYLFSSQGNEILPLELTNNVNKKPPGLTERSNCPKANGGKNFLELNKFSVSVISAKNEEKNKKVLSEENNELRKQLFDLNQKYNDLKKKSLLLKI